MRNYESFDPDDHPVVSVLGFIGLQIHDRPPISAVPDAATMRHVRRQYRRSAVAVFENRVLTKRQRQIASCVAAAVVHFHETDARMTRTRLRQVAGTQQQTIGPLLTLLAGEGTDLLPRGAQPLPVALIAPERKQPNQELSFAPTEALLWLTEAPQRREQPLLEHAVVMLQEEYPIDNS